MAPGVQSRSRRGGGLPSLVMRAPRAPLLFLYLLGVAALGGQQTTSDGQWTMPGKDYAVTRFSALATITPANAPRLVPVWTFSTGVLVGHEGQPLVVDNTIYARTPHPNDIYAFSLTTDRYPPRSDDRPGDNQS